MRFRSVLDTQTYDADRAIFPWQQCYSSFRFTVVSRIVTFPGGHIRRQLSSNLTIRLSSFRES